MLDEHVRFPARAVIFVKLLPADTVLKQLNLRNRTCAVMLDVMDMTPVLVDRLCKSSIWRTGGLGLIADNAYSWRRITFRCPMLRNASASFIEHFHSVPAPVADGSRPLQKALLLQEHHEPPSYCQGIGDALPREIQFGCITL